MLNERLRLAKQLLKDDGVIFVSIDDNEQAYLKVLMDEIFGEENFAGTIIHNKSNAQNDAQNIEKNHDYIHCYIKKIDNLLKTSFDSKKEIKKDKNGYYVETGMTMGGGISGTLNGRPLLGWTIYYNPLTNDIVPLMDYDINLAKASNNELAIYKNDDNLLKKGYQIIRPPKNGQKLGRWKWSYEKVIQNLENIIIKKSSKNEYNFSIYRKTYLTISDNDVIYKDNKYYVNHQNKVSSKSIINLSSGLGSITLKNLFGLKPFSNPKSVQLIKYLINLKTWKFKDYRILDFYAGSGTTGHAVMELNKEDGGKRTYTLVTNNENNIGYDVCYERLYRVNNGIGANNETFEWTNKNKPYNQNLNVFSIDYYDTSILKKDDNDSITKIRNALAKEIEEFGITPSANFNVDIYYDLLSLKPILKGDK